MIGPRRVLGVWTSSGRPAVPDFPPVWPTVNPERPWALPALVWNFCTPWAWARIWCHAAEGVLFRVWYWSRGPVWWIEDSRTSLDWRIQGKVKELHEQRQQRAARRRRGDMGR